MVKSRFDRIKEKAKREAVRTGNNGGKMNEGQNTCLVSVNYHRQRRWLDKIVLKGTILLLIHFLLVFHIPSYQFLCQSHCADTISP